MKDLNNKKLDEALKIKKDFDDGKIDADMANAQMKAHIGNITPLEFAYVEQNFTKLNGDECHHENIEDIMQIYKDVLVDKNFDLVDGHPIKNYIEENQAIKNVFDEIDKLFEKPYIKNQWNEQLENLSQFKTHLSRKQNQLYSALEKKGFDVPTTIMWSYDNEVRDSISNIYALCKDEFDYATVKPVYEECKKITLDLIAKEETILYKVALDLLSEEEFINMCKGDDEIGYCLIDVKLDFRNRSTDNNTVSSSQNSSFEKDLLDLMNKYNLNSWNEDTPMNVSTGLLSLNQINLIFKHLPVDISYVDEKDIVAFYTDTKHRVFPRSKGVIGRKVQNCHPSNSVHIVEEIIEKFKYGQEDKVDFWINKDDVFIYILYVAVRDDDGNFKGVMEMMQDASHIRSLTGSKTLLTWDKDNNTTPDNVSDTPMDSEEKITKLSEDLKLDILLKQYPTLKDYMIEKSDKFQMMKSPMFKVLRKIATVKIISEKTGISIDRLQQEFDIFLKSLK